MADEIVQAGTPLKVISSGPYRLNWRDVGKGLIVAVGAAVVRALYEAVAGPDFTFSMLTFKPILLAGFSGGSAYIVKNFFTDAKVVAVKP